MNSKIFSSIESCINASNFFSIAANVSIFTVANFQPTVYYDSDYHPAVIYDKVVSILLYNRMDLFL